MSIRVIQAGMQSSLQDGGRYGHQREGIPVGGAMDIFSFQLANLLVGNPTNTPVIEFTGFGATLIPDVDLLLSVCGGGCRLMIHETEVPFFRPVFVKAFSVIQLVPSANGFRSYLSVRGGLNGQFDFGSISTYPVAELGGVNGKYLKAGNVIACNETAEIEVMDFKTSGDNQFMTTRWGISEKYIQTIFSNYIRVVKGPEWDYFAEGMSDLLFSQPFIVSEQSNRMGYRLSGPPITPNLKDELVSTAVTSGVIQCTQNGDLLLLMADAQTTGGYPRIAKVASVDVARCAQLKPGSEIRFQLISEEEAEKLYLERENQLNVLRSIINLSFY
jgi:antagonist of KipI